MLRKALKRCLNRAPLRRARKPEVTVASKEQLWSIGIYFGESPFTYRPSENADNPVLSWANVSDVPAMFVADPFMISVEHGWYMFFEVMNRRTCKGQIGYATSEDGLKWTYRQIVLSEPYHLSYPYVFEWMNQYYMIPESYMAGSIRLYRALDFPTKWSFAGTLLSGPHYADSSIFRYENKWWLYTETTLDMQHDTLRLYHAHHLTGPWLEHPRSPIIAGNPHIARPAGRALVVNNKPFRYAQDCYPIYGAQVRAFEITELTTTTYHEREIEENPVLTGSGVGWNKSGMHHIDPHPLQDGRWIACVDGFLWR